MTITGEVVRIDRDAEARAWLLDRFQAMTSEIVTTWDIAQDIAANWTEGRQISELPECAGKYPGQVFREWLEGYAPAHTPVDAPDKNHLYRLLKAARVKRLAPPEYDDLPWSLYAELPADADKKQVASVFKAASRQPLGVSKRSLRLVQGTASGMKPPYWQQVITNLMEGAHGLTPAIARNIAATAVTWIEENPDAPTRQ